MFIHISFEWTNKMWHFHIMEYYSVKSTDTCSNRMNLENMLNERNQGQKITYCMIPFI